MATTAPAASEGDAPPSPPRSRKYIPICYKIELCIEAERVVFAEKNVSLRAFCRTNDIQPSQLRRWRKLLVKYKRAVDDTTRKRTKLNTATGRPSRLEKIRDHLMPWVDAHLNAGKQVTVRLTAVRAKRFDRGLRRMKRYILFAMVRRFLKAHGVVTRCITHKSQEDPAVKKAAASYFQETTRRLLHQPNRHKAFIINMDQTPYNPKDAPSRTLAYRGSRTVNAKEMKTSVGRVTAMLSVCADGTKLPPLLIFKGKPGGSVEKETPSFPKACKYEVQSNAWTDERVMLQWVETVLKPYVANCPSGIVPYLILDKYKCHYQGSVAKRIEELGVEWDIIPGGCTGLVQPIDVGIGKPWKNRMRYKLEEWWMNQEDDGGGFQERVKPKECRRLIAEWACTTWDALPTDIVYNSWRHIPFSYFPDEPTRDTLFEHEPEYSSDEEDNEVDDDEIFDEEIVGVEATAV